MRKETVVSPMDKMIAEITAHHHIDAMEMNDIEIALEYIPALVATVKNTSTVSAEELMVAESTLRAIRKQILGY